MLDMEAVRDYHKTGKLNLRMICYFTIMEIRNPSALQPWMKKLLAENAELDAEVKVFEREVWFGVGSSHKSVKQQVEDCPTYGLSCKTPSKVEVRQFCSAGRAMFTMVRGDVQITTICAQECEADYNHGRGTMGIQSLEGTKDPNLGFASSSPN